MITYMHIAERARSLLPDYLEKTSGIPYEAKGVLSSEMLFMLACLGEGFSGRILESGRARGQSTLLLAKAMPATQILSIEYDEKSPDAAFAESRLSNERNVTLLFGDARKVLPEILKPGDAVIIDGPKMFRAVRLALSLLSTGKVTHVFLHDVSKSTPERRFLDLCMPEARFSDQREVALVTHKADLPDTHIPDAQKIGGFSGNFGYGFSLGCLPYIKGRSYTLLLAAAVFYDLYSRSINKLGLRRTYALHTKQNT